MLIDEIVSSDATRFAVCFDFLTRLSSTTLLTFKLNESMFLLKSMTSLTMSRNVRSISDKSFDSERLFFIARLSRADDDDEIIDVDEQVTSEIERDN
jgi:hypothetical protein